MTRNFIATPVLTLVVLSSSVVLTSSVWAEDNTALKSSLTFHASFDRHENADFALGEPQLFTAASLKREKVTAGLDPSAGKLDAKGRFGGSLYFPEKSTKILFFRGGKNINYSTTSYGTTVSFWMSLTPDQDLPAGYVDPLQITDKKWNDASIFVDFDKDLPRQFRLGVFSDYKYWNPQDRKYETIPESERPLVSVKRPPFARDRWTHVVITLDRMNSAKGDSDASLYLDGKLQGTLSRKQQFTWKTDDVAIMLGIFYIGRLDDLAIFNRALTRSEVKLLNESPHGIRSFVK